MRFLLTNDDGIDAPGLLALARAFQARGEVVVIAPDAQHSGFGQAFSYRKPIHFEARVLDGGLHATAVAGTPVDCVKMGLYWHGPFDWVLSGINQGSNLGIDAFYSGTVGAASEGAIQGVPGIAFSLESSEGAPVDLAAAAARCVQVFEQFCHKTLPAHVCLSVNLPAHLDAVRGIRVTSQAQQRYVPEFTRTPGENGRSVAYRNSVEIRPDLSDGVDYAWLKRGWITVTPLSIDRTHKPLLEEMRTWTWTL